MISLGFDDDIVGGGQVVGSSSDEPLALPQHDSIDVYDVSVVIILPRFHQHVGSLSYF